MHRIAYDIEKIFRIVLAPVYVEKRSDAVLDRSGRHAEKVGCPRIQFLYYEERTALLVRSQVDDMHQIGIAFIG